MDLIVFLRNANSIKQVAPINLGSNLKFYLQKRKMNMEKRYVLLPWPEAHVASFVVAVGI